MSQESETATISAPSHYDSNVQVLNKQSKIAYPREFLLSLAKVYSPVKLPIDAQALISRVVHEASGLLSLPSCAPDSRCQRSVPQNFSPKVQDDVNQLLHRSDEPYLPPCRYKVLPSSTRNSNDLLNSDSSGSSGCTNQEIADREIWRKDTVSVAKEEKWHSSKIADSEDSSPDEFLMSPATRKSNSFQSTSSVISKQYDASRKSSQTQEKEQQTKLLTVAKEEKWHSSKIADSEDSSPDEFLMSPATRKSNSFQSTSSVISEQYDASRKSSQTQGAVRSDAGPPTLLETDKNCPTPSQEVQDSITNGSVNAWLKTVNHVDTSWHLLSMMDDGVHLMQAEESSNLDVEHQEGTSHVMELLESRPPSFLSDENYGNHKKKNCKVAYEQDNMELQLSNTSVSVYDSPGRISTSDPSEVCISPTSVEGETYFVSMIDDCDSSMVYSKGISVSMKQNPSSTDFQIHRELELNSSSHSLDGESNSSYDLCLPDEDSLITFDELFLMPDVENLPVVDSSMSSSPESNPIEPDVFSPSSPREMVEKLVEFILNDDSSTRVDDPIAHHEAGLGCFSHSMHPQQTHTQFFSNQLNPERDQQNHSSFERNSIDSTIYSFFSHSFPSNTSSQPSPLYDDELRRFNHEASQSLFQQMINPGKLHFCSLCISQSGVPPHLPALQMASCTQKPSSMQSCPFVNQTPRNYGEFIRPSPGFQGDCNINPAVVDSFTEMKLRASHWQPHLRGFC